MLYEQLAYNKRNGEYQVWQQNNQPKELYYPRFISQKIGYIHRNPVKAGIVDEAAAYIHSSARNYLGRTDFLIDVQVIDYYSMASTAAFQHSPQGIELHRWIDRRTG